jgi:hypothetical protein
MIAVPSLPQVLDAGLRAQKDEWDDSKLHISDLAVAIGEKCPRQLWLRLQGAEKKPHTSGQLLMFDHGNRIHERLVEIIRVNLNGGWQIQAVEKRVELGVFTGRYDTRLWNSTEGWEIIVDFKSIRGRAFSYLEEAKPANVLQVQAYIMAADADGGLVFYVDREGQNQCKQFYVARDDERVSNAMVDAVRLAKGQDPGILEPKLVIGKNKGPDSVKLTMPWNCNYCDYLDVSCPGALKKKHRELGIVGYVVGGAFSPKVIDGEIILIVEDLIEAPTPF